MIDPKKVKWKLFYQNSDGQVTCVDERPQDMNTVAIITNSSWYWGRVETPAKMKFMIENSLKHEAAGLCLAVPCDDLEVMKKYYGGNYNNPEIIAKNYPGEYAGLAPQSIEDDYVCLRMHDDLCEGRESFLPIDGAASMPAEKGAEQLISAIEKGFDIWSCGGGDTAPPKFLLCENYFAQNPPKEGKSKVNFISFSDGSTSQFYLRGLINPIHGVGFMRAMSVMPNPKGPRPDMAVTLISILKNQETSTSRNLICPDGEDLEEIKIRYNEHQNNPDPDKRITNLTCFPRQLRFAGDALWPKFHPNEKIILGLEGYSQLSTGHNLHEALFYALDCGMINPANVLFISIEDIIKQDEVMTIRRVNGLIPPASELTEFELEEIATYAKKIPQCNDLEGAAQIDKYIKISNTASLAEVARIKAVAKHFKIPTVLGGHSRAGHASNPAIQPAKVTNLEFQENQVIQNSSCEREIVERDFTALKPQPRGKPNWQALSAQALPEFTIEEGFTYPDFCYNKNPESTNSADTQNEINKAKILPLNHAANSIPPNILAQESQVIGGNVFNLAETGEISGKGLIIYLPNTYEKGVNTMSDLYNVSGKMQEAEFVVLSMQIPNFESDEKRNEYLTMRNLYIQKFCDDLKIQTPVFITTTSTNPDKLSSYFEANFNLAKALRPDSAMINHEATNICSTSSKKLEQVSL